MQPFVETYFDCFDGGWALGDVTHMFGKASRVVSVRRVTGE
jgi:hypothetical protein